MRGFIALFFFMLLFSCGEETAEDFVNDRQLIQIKSDNRLVESFEYEGGLLVKENIFSMCEQNPSDEFAYSYHLGKVITIEATLRGIYSNASSVCDPSKGLKRVDNFEYTSDGKISRVIRENSISEWAYNASGFVEKQLLLFEFGAMEEHYTYDSKGNLLTVVNSNGSTTRYEYDDKTNPFYRMNKQPGLITAFNRSPNNVIRASGSTNFERIFEYSADGFPKAVFEDNGETYNYIYK